MLNTTTIWILSSLVAMIGLVDLWLLRTKGREATFSYTIAVLARRFPLFPLGFGIGVGILLGHLFASQCGVPCNG